MDGDFTIAFPEYYTIGSFPVHFRHKQIHREREGYNLNLGLRTFISNPSARLPRSVL